MDTQTVSPKPEISEKTPNVFRKAGRRIKRTKAYRWLEGTYAFKFTTGLIADNKFWSRFNGMLNGGIWVSQAVWAMHALPPHIPEMLLLMHAAAIPALPLLAHVAVIAGCCAVAGIGLCAAGYGLVNAWKSMEDLSARTFPKLNPLRKARLRVQGAAKVVAATPPARKLGHAAGNVVQKPLAQKFLGSRPVRIMHGLTLNQQDVFLAGVTLEGAAAASVFSARSIVSRAAKLPGMSIAGMAGMAGLTYVVVTCSLDFVACSRTLSQVHRAHKNAKKSGAEKSAFEPTANTAPAFNREAAIRGTAENSAPARLGNPAQRRSFGR